MTEVSEKAKGRWYPILIALKIEKTLLNKRNQSCPWCGGRDRFRWTDHQGTGSFYCSGCGAGDGVELVKRMLGVDFRAAAKAIEDVLGVVPDANPRTRSVDADREAMRRVWNPSRRVTVETPVGRYLHNRGIAMTAYPSCLRYEPDLWDGHEYRPAMLAQVVDAAGKAVNIHRTWLTADGQKAPLDQPRKVMPGPMPAGCAIRLSKPTTVLGIAEGIETALAAAQRFGLPVWSAINAGNLARFIPPTGVDTLMIFADHDRSFVGQAAAYACAQAVAAHAARVGAMIDIQVHVPPAPGTDWADGLPIRLTEVAA